MEKHLDRPNLRDQIYDIMKEMIVMREIKPDEKINEERLAERLRVSRTPIRETLCRLENEGIVQVLPRRGAFVIKQCKERVLEILQVRGVLEGLLAGLVAQHRDEKSLNKLEGLELSGDRIDAIKCYLTGSRLGDGNFAIRRMVINDKHGISRRVFNAKVNIYRRNAQPILLGIEDHVLDASTTDEPRYVENTYVSAV